MDRTESLIDQFRAQPPESDKRRELVAGVSGILADRPDHPAALPFLASVTEDTEEYELARIEAATALRMWPPTDDAHRQRAARALLAVMRGPDEDLVRQYVAMALGPYADDPEIHDAMAAAVLFDEDQLVRDNALAALSHAGPSDGRAEVLHRLADDRTLGREAARILTAWGLGPAV
ncbi:HEAT repeat domain-containing protein [Streptomyces brevispora]|uniref:HEAT repeat domain-containing protein n=1 Tax=Streptomyces brevispora TaxID=887462 RepID=A0A561UX32_9ACTN|nr:HEAT repeat domain-containing protein [Streptomyces brevispora]TWG03909.1 HEAT repeat protein [Streptomyces brevispora]WSC15057.1 HEAT repeat domain-containing protein [Streptomyces brevispora]